MSSSKKPSILPLAGHLSSPIVVKFFGGRTLAGSLKGYDELVNLVLDDAIETLEDGTTRKLGLVVCRGTQVSAVSPANGREEIENPGVIRLRVIGDHHLDTIRTRILGKAERILQL